MFLVFFRGWGSLKRMEDDFAFIEYYPRLHVQVFIELYIHFFISLTLFLTITKLVFDHSKILKILDFGKFEIL